MFSKKTGQVNTEWARGLIGILSNSQQYSWRSRLGFDMFPLPNPYKCVNRPVIVLLFPSTRT